jgi:Ser/Thr protein kinase RdoA (MazF antagonist)
VRRPATANSDFIRLLLTHLADKGFSGVPRALGTDEQGRDVFSFIEGDVPADLGFYDDDALRAAAKLIRGFHDQTMELAGTAETVCHNDLSPCNFVFRDGLPVAMIDFDAAAPGSRVNDLGYAAWLWLNLGTEEVSAADQRRRLTLFIETYGEIGVPEITNAILLRQELLVAEGRRKEDPAMEEWASNCLNWTRSCFS